MSENSNRSTEIRSYGEIMRQLNDTELLRILKKRKLYESEAAEQAIKEAIQRGLIHSEEDLVAHEFRDNPEKFQWFPKIENERARHKTMKSISRSLLILTVIPVISGGILVSNSDLILGSIVLFFGILWGFISWYLLQSGQSKWIYMLAILTALGCGWQVWLWIEIPPHVFLDYFVLVVLTGFIFYGLVFLQRLNSYRPD